MFVFAVIVNSTYTEEPDVDTDRIIHSPQETTTVPDGWNRYYDQYYRNGMPLTGEQNINGLPYYFSENGYLMKNKTIPQSYGYLVTNESGVITHYGYNSVSGTWSDRSYHYEDGVYSSILNLDLDIVQCDSFDFYLELDPTSNVNLDGEWDLYTRCSGEWYFAGRFQYQSPSTLVRVDPVPLGSFDGITARPVNPPPRIQYRCTYGVRNVLCDY